MITISLTLTLIIDRKAGIMKSGDRMLELHNPDDLSSCTQGFLRLSRLSDLSEFSLLFMICFPVEKNILTGLPKFWWKANFILK